jgi:hypothetical protein
MILFKSKNNQIVFENEDCMKSFNRIMQSYSNTDKMLVLTIDEYIGESSTNQIQLLKALTIKGSEISGYTYSEFENELVNNFAPYKYERSIFGEMVKIRKSISEMNRKEINIFIEQSIQFCFEFYDIKF